MDPIVWAILMMVVGLALVVLEVFIPSGGILGFLAAAAVLGSVFVAFSSGGGTVGFIFIGIAMIGLPSAVVLALKILPNTPIGRRLLLTLPTEDEVLPDDDPRLALQKLIGRYGKASSDMLPGGTIVIDKKTYEAVCESGAIDSGEPVEVVKVRNNRLVVRAVKDVSADENSDDVLSRPIDSVGIELEEKDEG